MAKTVGVFIYTVSVWAGKYKTSGLDVLTDKTVSNRPVGFIGEQRPKFTALARSDPPEWYRRWSLRLLPEKAVEPE